MVMQGNPSFAGNVMCRAGGGDGKLSGDVFRESGAKGVYIL